MTEAGWTHQTPIEPGWYWWRRAMFADTAVSTIVVEIFERGGRLVVDRYDFANRCEGEWLGPLSPTDRQQGRVAGLREAHVFAMEAGAFYTAHRISALIDKAQQAQEEKGVGDGN